MNKKREIRMLLKSKPVIEGAGVHLKRVFGFSEVPNFDPFLMLDDFRSDNPEHFRKGFPWHPHRGIETITYVLKGDVEHGDSMGNKGIISSGDVQWMTAGSGIIHQEMPKGDSEGSMHGFQLWTNLPASQKMMGSRYRGITASQIPEVVTDNGVRIKIIAGTVGGITGPVRDIVTNPEYLDCNVPEGVEYEHATKPDYTAFIYIIDGKGLVNDTEVGNQTLILFDTGEEFAIKATGKHVRFLLLTGEPLKETIAWRGPIVMNTQGELETAFREYQEGNFVKNRQSKIS
ncbi:MAG: pirin family protein [Deltaproteobacteria bacterium]|jgi:redox-sensitive bicupin YhaK (pirin superfamily)|nr:pirin family protein [Deltaproteobacteria bacterium]